MPLYHATWKRNLPSIMKFGLGGRMADTRNFRDVQTGLYLCVDPVIAVSFLIEAIAHNDDLQHLSPADLIAQMRVIVVDDSRIRKDKLTVDPNIERKDATFIYDGIIDISGLIILDVDTVLASQPNEEPKNPFNSSF
jgi:hypothetical protein